MTCLPTDYDQVAPCRGCGRLIWADWSAGSPLQYCCGECRLEGKRSGKRESKKRYYQTEMGQASRARQRHVRRMRKAGNGAVVEKFSPFEIYARDNYICQICKKKVQSNKKHPHPLSASLDHIIPFAEGGAHSRANTQLAHLMCNSIKGKGGTDQLRLL